MLEGTGYTTLEMERLLRIKRHFATVRPRYREFLSEFTGVDTEIFKSQIPGGMISNMESQLKEQGAADRSMRCSGGAQGPQGRGLSAAGHALQPDRRLAGGLQRADGPIQSDDRRVRRPDARLLWRDHRREGSRGPRDGAKHAKKQPITGRPADLLKPEWEQLRADALALAGCNGSDEDVLTFAMFPAGRAEVFPSAAEGPKNVGKDPRRRGRRPSRPTASAKPADGKGPITSPVTYVIKIGGKAHRVTVQPA